MAQITLNVTALKCAVDILAFAGQELLVLGDVIVGVRPSEAASQPVPKAPQARATKRTLAAMSDKILDTLSKRPSTTRELSNKFQLTSPSDRARVGAIIKKLVAEKKIVANNNSRYPIWIIPKEAP